MLVAKIKCQQKIDLTRYVHFVSLKQTFDSHFFVVASKSILRM